MSPETDRIPVPTNGHGPLPGPAPVPAPAPGAPTASMDGPTDDVFSRTGAGLAFSPGQLAIGFGIIASLILLVLGRRRRKG